MKLDIIVNPSLKTTLVKLDEDTIRTMFENYANVMGSAPADHEEPTSEQLSGVDQLVSSGNVPYIDLAIFGPHGSRFIKKMKAIPSSSSDTLGQSVADIPGPPDFRTWTKCWDVVKCAFLLFGTVSISQLDGYSSLIRKLSEQYGPVCWPIIYQADTRMRSEEFS